MVKGTIGIALVFAWSFVALPDAVVAQEKPSKLTVTDEFNIQTATAPQISPDGRTLFTYAVSMTR